MPLRRPCSALALLAGAVLAGCAGIAAPPPPAGAYDAAALADLVPGARAQGRTADGADFTITYLPDGGAQIRWTRVDETSEDTGRWHIREDGALCTTWRTLRPGVESCEFVVPTGPETVETSDAATGAPFATATIGPAASGA